jgi:hypothetical protein
LNGFLDEPFKGRFPLSEKRREAFMKWKEIGDGHIQSLLNLHAYKIGNKKADV